MSILITGANGQLGTILTKALQAKYGHDYVVSSDITQSSSEQTNFVMLDILNQQRIREVIGDFGVKQIYHLAAILSANGEWNPLKTWNVNLNAFLTVLEMSREFKLERVFFPSSIAVFGSSTPKCDTPQSVPMVPATVYGMSKLAGEHWCQYYHKRYGLDVRSLRYPGIIGHDSLPGGGTTDYAVEIFHAAINEGRYRCFLRADTRLPMIYMPDAIRATLLLMDAPSEVLSSRVGYNLAGTSFTPGELAQEIKKHYPQFDITYDPDFRQEIADSWIESINDAEAHRDWGWQAEYDLEKMVTDMLKHLC